MPRRPDIAPLRRRDLDPDLIAQFRAWCALAAEQALLPEAVTLASVDADGAPDARMVLLKGADGAGLRFFTNYGSAKAAQLDPARRAALVVYWRELDRQVRFRHGRAPRQSRVRRLLRGPPAGLADRRLGVAPVRAAQLTPRARPARGRGRGALRGRRGSAPGALGRPARAR